jgi:hypothetical protein
MSIKQYRAAQYPHLKSSMVIQSLQKIGAEKRVTVRMERSFLQAMTQREYLIVPKKLFKLLTLS